MPTYEYECRACHSQIDIWFSTFAAAATQTPVCTVCGSKKLKRLISRIAGKGADERGDVPARTAPPAAEESPQMLAQAMKTASAGRDMGQEFNEVAARLDKGESPKSIEKTLRKRRGQKSGPH